MLWGAGGFFIDGVLTAFVADDPTWTHGAALQSTLRFPFRLGGLLAGLAALVRPARNRRKTHGPARSGRRAPA